MRPAQHTKSVMACRYSFRPAKNMFMEMGIDMLTGMCIDMSEDMYIHMCIDMRVDMRARSPLSHGSTAVAWPTDDLKSVTCCFGTHECLTTSEWNTESASCMQM